MLNQDEFINRLDKIFNYYGLSAATFADEIKVQRSSISHLLSGRNKPSLEFVLKITSTYKEVTLEWLLHGKDSFPKKKIPQGSVDLFSTEEKKEESTIDIKQTISENIELEVQKKTTSSIIEKIVIFYKDGTFKDYSEK